VKRLICLFAAIIAVSIPSRIFCQALYSYLDESGVQHFTNIPPVKRVWNLKVTGSEPAAAIQPVVVNQKSEPFVPIIEKYARDYQLDPSLIHSIIKAESNFNPKAVSSKGAQGLMQLMPATAARLGVNNSFDPEQNIRGGVRHFRWLMDNFNNNLDLSLAAYNAGENLVQRLGRVPEIKETREYVRKITTQYDKKQLTAQTAQTAQNDKHSQAAPTYRYVDEMGVLHITNVPPLH
jgi:soluble lytic murein transglycosylase-like protein